MLIANIWSTELPGLRDLPIRRKLNRIVITDYTVLVSVRIRRSEHAIRGGNVSEVKIEFTHCIQDALEYGSDDENMVSRIFMDITAKGKVFRDVQVNVKQRVASNYGSDPLDVGQPVGYDGPLDYEVFRGVVERYYRDLVGSASSAFRFGSSSNIGGSGGFRMQNNRVERREVARIQVPDDKQ
jgi:hypothetical protein